MASIKNLPTCKSEKVIGCKVPQASPIISAGTPDNKSPPFNNK